MKLPSLLSRFKRKSEKAAPDTVSPRARKLKTVFAPAMFLESVQIPKKEIIRYITGNATKNFGMRTSFYYAYVYDKGLLNYIACTAQEYIEGRYTVFAAALLKQGNYFYLHEDKKLYYTVNHSGSRQDKDRLELKTGPAQPPDAVNLADPGLLTQFDKLPDTLKFRWSQRQNAVNAMMLIVPLFLATFGSWAYYLYRLKTLPTPSQYTHAIQNIDISGPIRVVGAQVNGNGVINKIVSDGKNTTFTIKFQDEAAKRQFLNKTGGELNGNGEVLFSTPAAGTR